MGYSFKKRDRLQKRPEFIRLSEHNRKLTNRLFIVLFDGNCLGHNRIGITVTKRVGNAVVRNRLKRLVREFYRHHHQKIESPMDLVVIAKKEASGVQADKIFVSLEQLFEKIRETT